MTVAISIRRRVTGAALVALGCAAMPASAHAIQERVVAELAARSDGAAWIMPEVAAYRGHVVWSTYDREGGVWRLMEARGGSVRSLPVAPRRAPFDVDLGPAADGTPVAVYSRCGARRDCDIYAYSLARARERRLALNTDADETWPAIWGARVAFVREGKRARSRPMWGRARGSGRVRPLAAPLPHRRAAISQLDMRGTSVAYRWTVEARDSRRSFIRFASTTGFGSWVGSGASSPDQAVADPELTSAGVQWRVDHAAGSSLSSYLMRQNLTWQGCSGPALRGSHAVPAAASAQDDDTTYVIDDPRGIAGTAALSLRAVTGIAFAGLPGLWRRVAPPRSEDELLRPAARSSAARCLFHRRR